MKRCPNGHENEDWRTTCETCYLALEEVEPPAPPPLPPEPEPPSPPPALAPAPAVELVTARVTVEPGTDAFCDVRVRNVGPADDTIALQVEGEPSAWTLPEPQSLMLSSGTEGTARLVFRLPASATVPPGEHPLGLRATSAASGASTVASGMVVIPGATPLTVDDDGAVPSWLRPAILAAVIVVGIVLVVVIASGDGELTNTTPRVTTTTGAHDVIDGDGPPTFDFKFPTVRLRENRNSFDPWEEQWQLMLDNRGYELGAGGADGRFGPQTHRATVKFQNDEGLEDDGVVDQPEWRNMLEHYWALDDPSLEGWLPEVAELVRD